MDLIPSHLKRLYKCWNDIPALAGVPIGAAVDPKYEDVGGETTLVITLSPAPFIMHHTSSSQETEWGNNVCIGKVMEDGIFDLL